MRLSTQQMFHQGIASIIKQQAQLQKTELQLTSGERILSPADDPAATQQIMRLNQGLAIQDQYRQNLDFASGQLAQTENVVDGIGNALQRIRELMVQANSGTQSNETRETIAFEIRGLMDETIALANTRDHNNQYIFAGYATTTQPFGQTASGVEYLGDDGQRYVQVGLGQSVIVQDSGRRIFMQMPSGNGDYKVDVNPTNQGSLLVGSTSSTPSLALGSYQVQFQQATPSDPVTYTVTDSLSNTIATGTYLSNMMLEFAGHQLTLTGDPANGDTVDITRAPAEDLFGRINTIVQALEKPITTANEKNLLSNKLARSLEGLDQASAHLSNYRSEIGVRMNYLDNQHRMNEAFTLHLEGSLAKVKELDFAEAISRLNLQLTGLDAAQQAYVKVQGLSLFNYI